ncbi:MAG TPA: hypothetical protein VGF13_05630 [Verrucomicrobiae bacterium]|jgi:hypothetical protein
MKTKKPTPRSLPGAGQDKTSNSQTEWEEQYAYSLGIQAYIYGFPWVYLSWIKWLWTTPGGEALAKAEGITLPSMPVNSFFLSPQLATGATPTGESPNRDTLYAIAWLDLTGCNAKRCTTPTSKR